MRLDKAAIAMLRVTALAWSIPFAQSTESPQPGVIQLQASNAAFTVAGVQGVKDGLATRE